MTEQRPQQPCITLHGAWNGKVGDPERQFRGEITESTVSSLKVGANVTVTYDAPTQRTTTVGEHGTYTLHAGSRDVKLMSFTNMTEKTGGKHDTETEYWQATPLPE